MTNTCKVCKGPLVNGQGYSLKAESKNFTVTVENVPALYCPKGHEGLYWYDKKFGTAFTDKLMEAGIMAKGRRTLTLRYNHFCVSCGEKLGKEKAPHEFNFEFDTPLRRGQFYKVKLLAPALHCKICNRYYMPRDRGHLDTYYMELQLIISTALKKTFIL